MVKIKKQIFIFCAIVYCFNVKGQIKEQMQHKKWYLKYHFGVDLRDTVFCKINITQNIEMNNILPQEYRKNNNYFQYLWLDSNMTGTESISYIRAFRAPYKLVILKRLHEQRKFKWDIDTNENSILSDISQNELRYVAHSKIDTINKEIKNLIYKIEYLDSTKLVLSYIDGHRVYFRLYRTKLDEIEPFPIVNILQEFIKKRNIRMVLK